MACKNHQKCFKEAVKAAELICKKKHLKFTKDRKAIFELIWGSHEPVKAYDLLKSLDKNSLHPPLVYRALNFLLENKFIHKIDSINSYFGCSHPDSNHDCYFLICSKCYNVAEACEDNLEKEVMLVAKKKGFFVENISLEITGVCKSCLRSLPSS